ncbi:MAG: ferredoxin-type protein NapF [Rhodospirillales bacterium]
MNRRDLLTFKGSRSEPAVRPPWTAEDILLRGCDGCGDCVDACPQAIISLDSQNHPALHFRDNGCTFCGDCIDTCPTNVLGTLAPKTEAREAEAREADARRPATAFPHRVEVTGDCLSLNAVSCRLCEDACDEAAIRFRLMTGGRAFPLISAERCTGCGNCIATCPVRSFKRVPADHRATTYPTQERASA